MSDLGQWSAYKQEVMMLKVNVSERAELIKKAVLAGVGATANMERIKSAINEAFEDLSKVGQDLVEDLQESGKGKTEQVQAFLENLQEEAARRSAKLGKQASVSTKRVAHELGLVTHDDIKEIMERLRSIESMLGGHSPGEGRKRKQEY
jgi:polyhydroxyalkanoate synthesis regulator phasin